MAFLYFLVLVSIIVSFVQGERIMSQLDDIKAALADIQQSQKEAADAATNIAEDLDELLALVQSGAGLDEIEASVKDIQTTARAQADALIAASQKFPVPPPPTP